MKINEYNEMMAYLTKPNKKPVIPKSKPKKSTREAYKEYLEIRPFLDAESQMFIEKSWDLQWVDLWKHLNVVWLMDREATVRKK